MRRNEHHNLLKTHIFKGLPSQLVPWGVRRASELTLVANIYISECCVWLLRPISRSLPLAQEGVCSGIRVHGQLTMNTYSRTYPYHARLRAFHTGVKESRSSSLLVRAGDARSRTVS